MTGALVILLFTVLTGVVLYLLDRRHGAGSRESESPPESEATEPTTGQECCGLHIVCEKDSLAPFTTEIEYYDDEELDRYRGREAYSYTPEESDEFRDILLTMLPQEVAGWVRALQVRGITLPADVREEVLLIMAEVRASHGSAAPKPTD